MYDLNKLFTGHPKANIPYLVELHDALSPLGIAALNGEALSNRLNVNNAKEYAGICGFICVELDKIFKGEVKAVTLPRVIKAEDIRAILEKLITLFGKELLEATLKVYCTPWEYYSFSPPRTYYTALTFAESIDVPYYVRFFGYSYDIDFLTFMNNWRSVLLGLGLMPQDFLGRCFSNVFRTKNISEKERIALAKELVIAGANPEAAINGMSLIDFNPPAEFTDWYYREWKGKAPAAQSIVSHENQPLSEVSKNLPHFEGFNEIGNLVAQILVKVEDLKTQVSLITKLVSSLHNAGLLKGNPLHFQHFMQNKDLGKKLISIFIKVEGAYTNNYSLLSSFVFSADMKIHLGKKQIKELREEISSTKSEEVFKRRYEKLVCRLFTEETRVQLFMPQDQETSSHMLEMVMRLGSSGLVSEVLNSFSQDNQKQLIAEVLNVFARSSLLEDVIKSGNSWLLFNVLQSVPWDNLNQLIEYVLKAFATYFLHQENITKPTENQWAILRSYLEQAENPEVLMRNSTPMALLLQLAFRWDNKRLFKDILEHPKTNRTAASACLEWMLDSRKQLHPARGFFENVKGVFGRSQVQTYALMLLKQFSDLIGVVREDADLAKWADDVEGKITPSDTTTKEKLEATETAPQVTPYAGTYDSTVVNTGKKTEPKEERGTAPQSTLSYPQPANPYARTYDSTVVNTGKKTEPKEEREARKSVDAAIKRDEKEAEAANGSSSGSPSTSPARLLAASRGNPMHAEGSVRAERDSKEEKRAAKITAQLDEVPPAPNDPLPDLSATSTGSSMSLAYASTS